MFLLSGVKDSLRLFIFLEMFVLTPCSWFEWELFVRIFRRFFEIFMMIHFAGATSALMYFDFTFRRGVFLVRFFFLTIAEWVFYSSNILINPPMTSPLPFPAFIVLVFRFVSPDFLFRFLCLWFLRHVVLR